MLAKLFAVGQNVDKKIRPSIAVPTFCPITANIFSKRNPACGATRQTLTVLLGKNFTSQNDGPPHPDSPKL